MKPSHDAETESQQITAGAAPLWPGFAAALLCTAIYAAFGSRGTFQPTTTHYIHHSLTADAWLHGRLYVTDDVLIRRFLGLGLRRLGVAQPENAPTEALADAYRNARAAGLNPADAAARRALTEKINREFGDYLSGAQHDWVTLPEHPDRHYAYWPPVPALLMLPVVAVWGPGASDMLVDNFLGGATVLFIYLLLRAIAARWSALTPFACVVFTLFYGLGTIAFWQACLGQVWFLSAVAGTMFLTASLWMGVRAIERPGWIVAASAMLAPAFLCRYTIVLAAPFFAVMLWLGVRESPAAWRRFIAWGGLFALPLLLALGFLLWFNHARFGDPLDFGQGHLADSGGNPRFVADFKAHGRFSPFFIPRNVFFYLLNPRMSVLGGEPSIVDGAPSYDADGNSILLISPALAYVALAWRRRRELPHRVATLGPWSFIAFILVQAVVCRDYTAGDLRWPDSSGAVRVETLLLGVAAIAYLVLVLRERDALTTAVLAGALPGTMVLLCFHGTGFCTFGPRYLLDTLPLWFLLAVFGMRGRLSAWPLALMGLSVAINAWGAYRVRLEQY